MESELKIERYELEGNNLEAYYFEKPGLRAMAIKPSIAPERFRLWELVAHGLSRVPDDTRRRLGRRYPPGGFYFFGARNARDADRLAVRAVAEVIEEMEPGWVSAVEGASRMADAPAIIAAWSGVPIEAVRALAPGMRPERPETPSEPRTNVGRPAPNDTPRRAREEERAVEVPRETSILEGFEVWDRTVHAPEHQGVKVAFVSVRVGGNIGMNRAAYEMWGAPEACQVMFDPKRRRIGLKPARPGEANSYDLYGGGGIQISCKKLFDYYGVEIPETRRYHDPKVVDGVLVVDL